MTARPRLLFLSQCLPYPPHSGVANRTFNILRQLRVEYDIDLVAFYRLPHQPDRVARDAAWKALRSTAAFVAEPTPIPSEHSTLRKIWDHVRSIVSTRAYTYYEYQSRAFADRLRDVLRERTPDLVHLDSLDLHPWLSHVPGAPIACTHHDIDSALLRQRARHLRQAMRRRYLLFQADRLERAERTLCPRLALNVMMSEIDAQRLRALAPGAATVVVPNGTDTAYFQPTGAPSLEGRIAFVGPTYNHPNRDAVEFLLQEIWPRVRAGNPTVSLHLIGRSAPEDRARYDGEPGVTTLGYVPDIRPSLSAARCCVVPIRIGGGTRLKILDAWAMGKAVVSTSIGCEGLDAVDGENILIRDAPGDFADAVLQVLRDPPLRSRLERNARRVATETYDWGAVGRRIRAAYQELLSRSATPPPGPRRAPHANVLGGLRIVLLASLGLTACRPPTFTCDGVPGARGEPHAHEPPGFRPLSDQPWNALRGNAWSYLRRTGSRDDDIAVDRSAPRSAPEVLRIVFTPDMAPNTEPGVYWLCLPAVKAVYAVWWIKLSPNWTSSPAGGGKITFLWAEHGQGQVYTGFFGASAPHHISVNTEWAPYGQKIWDPNVTTTSIVYDQWYRIEWYMAWESSPGAGDGVMRWWVNGVLNGDYRTLRYPLGGFGQFEFAPTLQQPPPAEQYMYVDHVYVSIPRASHGADSGR